MYKPLALLGLLSASALAQPLPSQPTTPPAGADSAPTEPTAPTTTAAPVAPSPEVAPAQPAPPPPTEQVTKPAEPAAAPTLPFKLYGKTYFDASYTRLEGDGLNTSKTRGVDVKRFYLGIDFTLNKIISATFVTDIGDKAGKYDVFVKKGFVQAKVNPELAVRAGVGDTSWIPFLEDNYGYRYLEQTLIDRTKFGTSSDWGVTALGRVANGLLGYHVSIVNGNGYGNPTRAKWPSVEARVDAKLVDHLIIAGGASISTLGATTTSMHTGKRFDGFIGWNDKRVRAGAEVMLAKNYTADQLSGKAPENTARGVSVFASYRFLPEVGALARIDVVQPVADTDTDISDTYANVGVEYVPYKFLNLALVYKRDMVHTGAAGFTMNTGNGAIGSPMPDASGTYNEIGVFGQLVF